MNLRRACSWPVSGAGLLLTAAVVTVAGICALAPSDPARVFHVDTQDGTYFIYRVPPRQTGSQLSFSEVLEHHTDFIMMSLSSIIALSAIGLVTGGGFLWLGRRLRST